MRLSGVGYRYGWRAPWVLSRVDLELQTGTLIRVGGYNGTGKSTLMRIIAGVHRPGRGTVTGRPGQSAYVPGQLPPLPLKAHDYLRHCGRIRGLSAEETDERVHSWLERFEALSYRKHQIGDLSRGTAQKVAIIQALLAEPDLLVLDEAWTSLDTAGQETLDEVARSVVQRGGRVVFVDHDPQRLDDDASDAYVLRDGILSHASAVDFEMPLVVIDLENAPQPWPGPGRGRLLADDVLRIEVEPDGSDQLLHEILSKHPEIHVSSVRTVDGRAAQPTTSGKSAVAGTTGAAGASTQSGPNGQSGSNRQPEQSARLGSSQPGTRQPGSSQPGNREPESRPSGSREPESRQPDSRQPGSQPSSIQQSGSGQLGTAQLGSGQLGTGQSGRRRQP